MILNSIILNDFPSIDDLVDSNLGTFNFFAENDCGYVGSAYDFILE